MSKRKEVTTYAVLDNCSQGTFVKEDIHKLEASGARTKITVKTMNDGQTHTISTAVDGLEVASNKKSIGEQWIKLPNSYTTSDLPMEPIEVIPSQEGGPYAF